MQHDLCLIWIFHVNGPPFEMNSMLTAFHKECIRAETIRDAFESHHRNHKHKRVNEFNGRNTIHARNIQTIKSNWFIFHSASVAPMQWQCACMWNAIGTNCFSFVFCLHKKTTCFDCVYFGWEYAETAVKSKSIQLMCMFIVCSDSKS